MTDRTEIVCKTPTENLRVLPHAVLLWEEDVLHFLPDLPEGTVYLSANGLRFPLGRADILLEDGRMSAALLLDSERDSLRIRLGDGEAFLIPTRGAKEHLFSFRYPPTDGEEDGEIADLLRFF